MGSSTIDRGNYRLTLGWYMHPCLHLGFTLEVEKRDAEGERDGIIIVNGGTRAFVDAEALLKAAADYVGDVKDAYQDAIRSGSKNE